MAIETFWLDIAKAHQREMWQAAEMARRAHLVKRHASRRQEPDTFFLDRFLCFCSLKDYGIKKSVTPRATA